MRFKEYVIIYYDKSSDCNLLVEHSHDVYYDCNHGIVARMRDVEQITGETICYAGIRALNIRDALDIFWKVYDEFVSNERKGLMFSLDRGYFPWSD